MRNHLSFLLILSYFIEHQVIFEVLYSLIIFLDHVLRDVPVKLDHFLLLLP